MPSVYVDISVSLDGFAAGPHPSLEDPLGKGGEALHDWVLGSRAWRESHGYEGGEEGPNSEVVATAIARQGAVVMGRLMFSGGQGPWEDDPNANGWWGDEPPFRCSVFVLTHHQREDLVLGETTFVFVTDGVEAAVSRARDAAGDRDVLVAGGAAAVQQALGAGLVDDLTIHVAPVLLGEGTRLFDGGVTVPLEGPAARHLRYDVRR